jgi:hypothetical protein
LQACRTDEVKTKRREDDKLEINFEEKAVAGFDCTPGRQQLSTYYFF